MIDFWAEHCRPGEAIKLPVVVINDLDTNWQGRLTLRLTRQGKTVTEKSRQAKVAAAGREVFQFDVSLPAAGGDYQLVAELRGAAGEPVRSLRDFRISSAEKK